MAQPNPLFKDLWRSLHEKLKESLVSVVPVSLMVFLLAITPWVDISRHELLVFGAAALLLIIGISLFNLGADMAMTPMGQYIGEGLTKSRKLGILLSICFLMGLLITIAEPDLSVLAGTCVGRFSVSFSCFGTYSTVFFYTCLSIVMLAR